VGIDSKKKQHDDKTALVFEARHYKGLRASSKRPYNRRCKSGTNRSFDNDLEHGLSEKKAYRLSLA